MMSSASIGGRKEGRGVAEEESLEVRQYLNLVTGGREGETLGGAVIEEIAPQVGSPGQCFLSMKFATVYFHRKGDPVGHLWQKI